MTVPVELRRAGAHAFVDDLDLPTLDDVDRHHLVRALRLAPGESVSVGDGRGSWRMCRHLGDGALEPVGELHREPAPRVEIGVAFAPVKGDRVEWVVQKLTELGVDRIVPMFTERSIVRWDGDRAMKQHERLLRVAREAAMQSRRTWLPTVEPATTFGDAAARPGACLAEPGGGAMSLDHPFVLVGPEGGFAPNEISSGISQVDLPGGILRAETASITAGVLLTTLR